MLYFGTSGFSYKDWVGHYYPDNLPHGEWLRYYAREFNTLELNSSYYAIPSAAVVRSLLARTGSDFLFSIKAHQDITHGREVDKVPFDSFLQMLDPFVKSGKLGCILAQFPYSFKLNKENQAYIEVLRDKFNGLPLVVEFRNIFWIKSEVFDWLRRLNIGFCCVDEPHLPNLIPPVGEATSNMSYVRFHGRNADKWWQHEQAYERYDYTYSEQELSEWVPRIKNLEKQSERTFVFANNHWKGQSVNTIRQLRLMLD